jgi:TetR/AcrR family transcriptional repressor of mexCD-oprJ operon
VWSPSRGETKASQNNEYLSIYEIIVLNRQMAQSEQMRAQVTAVILDAAASVIADHGEAANMAEVATAAGISRATLYRYFDSRDNLMRALSAAAIDDVEGRLVAADLEHVSVPVALERAARAVVAVGVKFAVVMEDRRYIDPGEVERRIGVPIRAVFERGVVNGTLRSDLSIDVLTQLWGGLLEAMLRAIGRVEGGVEGASAAVSSLFMEGVASRDA